VLSTTLGGGFTSRLTQKLREEMGIIYNGHSVMDYRVATGPFLIATAIVSAQTANGLSEIFKILESLSSTDVPAAELAKSKQNLIRALPAMFETNAATAGTLAELALQGLPDNWYATYAANLRKVTAKDVKAVAKAVIPPKNMAISIVGDLGKIRADVDKLGFGEAAWFDLYGTPTTAPAPSPAMVPAPPAPPAPKKS
jgi:zinc protease